MAYVLFAVYAPLSFVLNVLTYLLAPFLAVLSVVLRRDTLPGFLSLFHTHNDTLDGGQHQLGWPKASGLKLIVQRMKWIWRNPAYGFDAYFFGLPRGEMTRVELLYQKAVAGDEDFVAIHRLTYKGRNYFSYRRHWLWLGWNPHGPGKDRHMLKFSLRNLT